MLSLAVALGIMSTSAAIPVSEALRPQYHFTAPKGWLNDPNGLVYYRGEYHLFYQHNPFSTQWGNMTWGHAVSKDLVHWKNLPNALEPDATGTMYSGSAVVDWNNTSGFGAGKEPPMVMFYTAAGGKNDASKGVPFTQGLAYSTDGRTFKKFDQNPIVPFIEAENRDPKVIWHEPSKSWVMALYLDGDRYVIFRSPDLKKWTKASDLRMPGASECPDIFELKLDKKSYWIFWGANGRYRLGDFDGYKFDSITEPIESILGPNDYAAQTYSDEPRHRRIQISWMRDGHYPDMPFNQQMTIPREMTLTLTEGGPRLAFAPIAELANLRQKKAYDQGVTSSATIPTSTELLEIRAVLKRDENAQIKIGEQTIAYDARTHTLSAMGRTAKVGYLKGDLDIVAYMDRTTLEVFADRGLIPIAGCFVPKEPVRKVKVEGKVSRLQVWELKSALED